MSFKNYENNIDISLLMKIGIIRYPGSNCYQDTVRFFGEEHCIEIWYKQTELDEHIDLLVIPGGFAFGDRYYEKATDVFENNPGKMAIEAPVTSIIRDVHLKNIPILGICNGFQILTKLELLPGRLIRNVSGKFISEKVQLHCSYTSENHTYNTDTEMYIANYFGNYQNEDIHDSNIFLTYSTFENGSTSNIAGIHNDSKTVFGMMPHPERNSDFKSTLLDILFQQQHKSLGLKIENLLHSEHISYKSTKQYLKTLYTEGPHVVQGPGENAGIVDIGDGYCITIRIESHNHPTFKNAYEGAATGVGGIIRDIICMGSKPIALLDFLRFGTDVKSDTLLQEAIRGISYYGNTIGIPNVGGSLHRSSMYNTNPLVNVACLGIVRKENIIYGNALRENSVLILCGAKTGNEGVDSAVMASKPSTHAVEKDSQKADAYLENLLLDAFVEISDRQLAEGCQDLGAGGILCATTEVIKRGREKTGQNLGCNIYIDKVSLKENLDSYSILASETQERMLVISEKKNIKEIETILTKWDLEYNQIGEVTMNGLYNVFDKSSLIYSKDFNQFTESDSDLPPTYSQNNNTIEKIKNPDLWKSYDHSIGCRTLKGPDEPGSYAILDIYEIDKQLIITWGNSVNECYQKLVELNGTPLGIVNGLNFGDPKTCIGNFIVEVDAMNKQCKELNIPVLGGNVSMYNCTDCVDISPTIVIVMIGLEK